jgi:hypothetical protein
VDDLSSFVRRQISSVVERLLVGAGVAGVFPTPLEALDPVAGIREVVDISDLPPELEAAKPSALRRILGALVYRTETVFVDGNQPGTRARFIHAHEIGHRALPWHRDSYYLDDEMRLFREPEELLDRQANAAAAEILFQGDRFHRRALDYEYSLKTPVLLAPEYGTSFHATIRHYAERHPEPVAVLIAGRYRSGGGLPIWGCIESPSFRRRFGSMTRHLPGTVLDVDNSGADPYGNLASIAMASSEVVTNETALLDRSGASVPFVLESFFNQRCVFLLAAQRKLLRLGRRVRVSRVVAIAGGGVN